MIARRNDWRVRLLCWLGRRYGVVSRYVFVECCRVGTDCTSYVRVTWIGGVQ